MRVGINLVFLVPGETGGTETYARNLVPALADVLGPESLTLFLSDVLAAELRERPWVPGAAVEELPIRGRTRVRRTLAEQTLVPRAVRRSRVDVLHNLQSIAPYLRGAPAMVTTVLDLLYLHHPDTHSPLLRRGMGVLVPMAVRRSDRVIAISQATKDDVVRSLGTPAGKVDVVHLGPGLAPVAPLGEAEVRARFELGDRPFVISPSARRAHKNLPRLLGALARADPAIGLVLPGYATGEEDELAALAEELGIADRVRFAGWVTDAELEGLYASARALVFPSLSEGFGLPVLEAMARGLPVACADRTSLPEIAGDAALLFDPDSEEAIGAAIVAVTGDEALRGRLIAAGLARAAQFSWARAARETVETYERALSR